MTTTHAMLLVFQVGMLSYSWIDVYRAQRERELRRRLDRFCGQCGWRMER